MLFLGLVFYAFYHSFKLINSFSFAYEGVSYSDLIFSFLSHKF
ncbi:hypothetical protein HMPREF1045_1334 [Streptococcus mitis SK616]|nr:hypothetical protein HMPREF1045_1334 [Streptococcus mitis SK616]